MNNRASAVLNALRIPFLLASFGSFVSAQTANPPSQTWRDQPYVFGDWGGERSALERAGIVFKFMSMNDFLVVSRGADANLSRVRGTLDVDFGKLELVSGLKRERRFQTAGACVEIATASENRSINKATPGAPAGNIEKRRNTLPAFHV
jgi:carbohydrate-selective porin OprB